MQGEGGGTSPSHPDFHTCHLRLALLCLDPAHRTGQASGDTEHVRTCVVKEPHAASQVPSRIDGNLN
ncbi:hypothetical protein Cadr_000026706 [Camelus dromedarius]|uniref:Uncharacterized protein n=1 Tax=Camelus dromedarius TaxID=9838 RepID=A0A5N4CFA7_CAMDR|nr:hypothetical protein Cadr_000026706 [Camelus dromedarius]